MVLQTFTRTLVQTANNTAVLSFVNLRGGKNFVKIIQIQISNDTLVVAAGGDSHFYQIAKREKAAYAGTLVDPDIVWTFTHTDEGATMMTKSYPMTFRPMIPRFQVEEGLYLLYNSDGDGTNETVTFKVVADITPARY